MLLDGLTDFGLSASRDGDNVLELRLDEPSIDIAVNSPDPGGINQYFWPEIVLTSSDHYSSLDGGDASASGKFDFISSLSGKYSRYTDGSYLTFFMKAVRTGESRNQ